MHSPESLLDQDFIYKTRVKKSRDLNQIEKSVLSFLNCLIDRTLEKIYLFCLSLLVPQTIFSNDLQCFYFVIFWTVCWSIVPRVGCPRSNADCHEACFGYQRYQTISTHLGVYAARYKGNSNNFTFNLKIFIECLMRGPLRHFTDK